MSRDFHGTIPNPDSTDGNNLTVEDYQPSPSPTARQHTPEDGEHKEFTVLSTGSRASLQIEEDFDGELEPNQNIPDDDDWKSVNQLAPPNRCEMAKHFAEIANSLEQHSSPLVKAVIPATGFFSAIVYIEPSLKLEMSSQALKYLSVPGTFITNAVLNGYFLEVFKDKFSLLFRPALGKIGINFKGKSWVKITGITLISVYSALPFAVLGFKSILPPEFNPLMLGVSWLVFAALNYYSMDELVTDCSKLIHRSTAAEKAADRLRDNLKLRLDNLIFLLKNPDNHRDSNLLCANFKALLHQLNNPSVHLFDGDRSQIANPSLKILAFFLSDPQLGAKRNTLTFGRGLKFILFVLECTAVATLLGYLNSTVNGLTAQLLEFFDIDHELAENLAWFIGSVPMGIFAYLMKVFTKSIFAGLFTSIYNCFKDSFAPWKHPSWRFSVKDIVNQVIKHFYSYSMYQNPWFSSLILFALYFLGGFSWGCSLQLQDEAIHALVPFLLDAAKICAVVTAFFTVVFNIKPASEVADSITALVIRDETTLIHQKLIKTLERMLDEYGVAGVENLFGMILEFFNIDNSAILQAQTQDQKWMAINTIIQNMSDDKFASLVQLFSEPKEPEQNSPQVKRGGYSTVPSGDDEVQVTIRQETDKESLRPVIEHGQISRIEEEDEPPRSWWDSICSLFTTTRRRSETHPAPANNEGRTPEAQAQSLLP